MINEAFLKETDEIRKRLLDRKIELSNGNVLVARVKVDRMTAGGIFIHDDYADREEYKSGFAMILQLPEGYYGSLSVGDFCLFSHEARYKLYTSAIREILDFQVSDNLLYVVQDNNVILTIKRDQLLK